MRRDSRLSLALHALLHMGEERPLTSESLAAMMRTNPVVVRRTMAGLRDAGIVRSEKGHGGGWSLARSLASVTLGEVYAALGAPTLFSVGPRTESPGCLVEKAVNRALGQALNEAEALLLVRLHSLSVADVLSSARRKLHHCASKKEGIHA